MSASTMSTMSAVSREMKTDLVTKKMSQVSVIFSNEELTSSRKLVEVEGRYEELCALFDEIKFLDEQILATKNATDLKEATDKVNSYHDDLDNIQYDIKRRLEELRAAVNSPHDAPKLYVQSIYRLPELELPEFDGDLLSWRSFWRTFERYVHHNPELTSARKCYILNCQLRGDAKLTIAGLIPTNDNYLKAINLIKERYDQPKKIIAAHMRALYYLAPPNEEPSSLRLFRNELESHINGLKELGKSPDDYGDLLVAILWEKISFETRLNLSRHRECGVWTLQDFRAALKKEIDILNFMEQYEKLYSDPNAEQEVTSQRAGSRRCPLCDGPHKPIKCVEYPDSVERLRVAREKRLCFNCLSSNRHPFGSQNCNSPHRCRFCNKAHHTCLHVTTQDED